MKLRDVVKLNGREHIVVRMWKDGRVRLNDKQHPSMYVITRLPVEAAAAQRAAGCYSTGKIDHRSREARTAIQDQLQKLGIKTRKAGRA